MTHGPKKKNKVFFYIHFLSMLRKLMVYFLVNSCVLKLVQNKNYFTSNLLDVFLEIICLALATTPRLYCQDKGTSLMDLYIINEHSSHMRHRLPLIQNSNFWHVQYVKKSFITRIHFKLIIFNNVHCSLFKQILRGYSKYFINTYAS